MTPDEAPGDACLFPVQLDSDTKRGRVGFCQRTSASTLIVATPSQFSVGDVLDVVLLLSEEEALPVRGTVTSTAHLDGVGPFCRQLQIDVGCVPDEARGRRVLATREPFVSGLPE